MPIISGTFLALAFGLAGESEAIILTDGEVTYDFAPVSSPVNPALTPADVRVGRTTSGRLTVNGGSRLRVISGGGFDPGLIVARRVGSDGSAVLIDGGAIDLSGSDLAGGVFVHVGRDSFGRMTLQNGGELRLINPDLGNPLESGAGLSVGRSIGGGELLVDNSSVLLDSTNSAFAIGREGATARVTVQNGSTIDVLDDGPVSTAEGARIDIGRSGAANATVIVRDSDVTVRSNAEADLIVGREVAVGRFEVSGAASEVAIDGPDARFVVARDTGSVGRVRFHDGARLQISGDNADFEIASVSGADGVVAIENGAVVEVFGLDGDARVAADLTGFGSGKDGGTGRLEIRGAGSRLRVQDSVVAGSPLSFGGTGSPTASIIVADGGAIEAGRVFIGAGASLTGSGGNVFGTLINDGGFIGPGFSPGILTVDDFEQTAGTLAIEIGGILAGQFDVLNVLGDAVFSGGSILFSFIDGFLPSAGDIIPFLTATGDIEMSGTDFSVLGAPPDFDFSVNVDNGALVFLANSGATAVPEPPMFWTLLVALSGVGLLMARRTDEIDFRRRAECAR